MKRKNTTTFDLFSPVMSILVMMLLIPYVSFAADISIGGVSLNIPEPPGFSPVTQQMGKLYEWQKQFVPPINELFVTFIPDDKVPTALSGHIPTLPRSFSVLTAKSAIGASVTTSGFAKLKRMFKTQNDEITKEVERQMPGLEKKINDGIAQKFNLDLAFSVSQMIPYAVHEESDRTMAYSALVKHNENDSAGKPTSYVGAVTFTLVHVKGKILFLASDAEEGGLEWSRTASKQWADAVLLANPPDLQSFARELPRGSVGGIVGAVVGTLGALIWRARKKRHSSSP